MLPPLRIGKVELPTPLLLAPIAGYCDVSFRLVARSWGGVGLACTDLICPEGALRATEGTMRLTRTCAEDRPLAMQLYGANVDTLCWAAGWAEERGVDVVDINMGCPVDKVTKKNGGSKLLCDPDGTVRMVERVRATLKHTPLTCKLRLGWDDSCIVAPALARRLEEVGVEMITIHGRTTEMRFSGQARLDGIAEVVAAVKHIPVIGNGDVRTPADAVRMIEHTKCRGVMIGRGALSMPWIFRDTWALISTGQVPPAPTIREKCQTMRDHFQNIVRFDGERRAVMEFRKRVSWYAKQMTPCKVLREGMREINSGEDFERVMAVFLERRLEHDEYERNRRERGEATQENEEAVEAA